MRCWKEKGKEKKKKKKKKKRKRKRKEKASFILHFLFAFLFSIFFFLFFSFLLSISFLLENSILDFGTCFLCLCEQNMEDILRRLSHKWTGSTAPQQVTDKTKTFNCCFNWALRFLKVRLKRKKGKAENFVGRSWLIGVEIKITDLAGFG